MIWREALMAIGFMKDDKAEHMMLGLRRVLARSYLSENDVRILIGIARQTLWKARQRPGEAPEE
jgi:tRNA C32,U32 (ribose-2'-O)-methylase TrmJ